VRQAITPSAQAASRSDTQQDPAAGQDVAEWYEQLRAQYRPAELRVLLIGESPPDSGSGSKRFFYAPALTQHDNLYRGVAEAVYGDEPDFDLRDKTGHARAAEGRRLWLIDAVEHPINKTSASTRRSAIEAAAPRLVDRCLELSAEADVIICHGVVYAATAHNLRAGGVAVLHNELIPFPLGNWRAEFVRRFREALP
jgi:hypothetical protein